jgi:hypothetical protein
LLAQPKLAKLLTISRELNKNNGYSFLKKQ